MDTGAYRSPLKRLPLREPGDSLRTSTVDLVLRRLIALLWLTSIAAALWISSWSEHTLGWHVSSTAYALVTLALAIPLAVRFHFASREAAKLQLGRQGELFVGQFLEQQLLADGARVFHDIPADDFNLDHVVIAPQGIFVIETKTRSKPRNNNARVTLADDGTVRVGGYKPDRDPITQIRAACRWLSELLSECTGEAIAVRGVVVFPGWFVEPMSRAWLDGGHPWVLEPKAFPSFLKQERQVLDDRELKMVANHLDRYIRSQQPALQK